MTPEEFRLATSGVAGMFGDGGGFGPLQQAAYKLQVLSMLQMYDTGGDYDDKKQMVLNDMWAELDEKVQEKLSAEAEKIAWEMWATDEQKKGRQKLSRRSWNFAGIDFGSPSTVHDDDDDDDEDKVDE